MLNSLLKTVDFILFTEANYISKKVLDIENADPTKRSSSSSDSTNKPPILKKNSNTSITNTASPPPQVVR